MARHLWITGLVQGVGYRAAFAAEAGRLNLSGWVRNRLDGSVEALVDGPSLALDDIVAWSRVGPAHAEVERVKVTEAKESNPSPVNPPAAFRILPTE